MGRGNPPPRRCGPTDHTWLIPYGGEAAEITQLYETIFSLGEINSQNRVIVVDDLADTEFNLKGQTFPGGVQVIPNPAPPHSCAHALNLGLPYIETTWIWRMDSDDKAWPNHNREIACRETDENVVLLGGEMMTDTGRHLENRWDSNTILQLLTLHRNPIHHPATCLKTDAVRACGGWPDDCGQVEDYGLWCGLIRLGKFVAIKNVWTQYHQGFHTDRRYLLDVVAERMGW